MFSPDCQDVEAFVVFFIPAESAVLLRVVCAHCLDDMLTWLHAVDVLRLQWSKYEKGIK